VLIKATKIEETTEGGIVLPSELTDKEQSIEQTGRVVDIGPCAYVGWKGCDIEGKTPAECWGIKIGDLIEHKKYNGLDSKVEGQEGFRYVPDIEILGVIDE
jgi:co-chaperonin GroES (HSP10)